MLGEPELQGETTNLQTAEGMILDGKIDARGFMRKRKKETYRTLLIWAIAKLR